MPLKENGAPVFASQDSPKAIIPTRNTTKKIPAIQEARSTRLKYLARRLHALGEKPLFYFLDEMDRGADLRESLEIYAALPAGLIKAYNGDKFAAPFLLKGGRGQ
jgi:hypothetical protein